jgi:LysM repeat protein
MAPGRKPLENRTLLVLLGGGGLLFLIGTLCGVLVLGRLVGRSATPPPPQVVVATATSAAVTPTSRPGRTLPDGTFCPTTPGDWHPYTVQAGDTLSHLAAQAGTSQERTLQGNCITSPELLEGQVLYLPPTPTPIPCQPAPPSGWTQYTVQSGDSLSDLATARQTTTDVMRQVNCLTSSSIVEGQSLYLPSLPTPTPCVASSPSGWGTYSVQAGDTLSSLASARGTTVEEVIQANCLSSTEIQVGQVLYLPLLPTPTPTLFPTPVPVPRPAPLSTPVVPATAVAQALPQRGQPAAGAGQPQPGQQPAPDLGGPPQDQIGAAQSMFNAPRGVFGIRPGAPGGPFIPGDFAPCTEEDREWQEDGTPWLTVLPVDEDATDMPYKVENGQRVYTYVCGYSDPTGLKAWLTGPGQLQFPLDVQLYLSPAERDYEEELLTAQGVVVWSTTCDMPEGEYRLYVENKRGLRTEEVTFELKPSSERRILVVPNVALTGSVFEFYYCGYTPFEPIDIGFLYEAGRVRPTDDLTQETLEYVFSPIGQWTITPNAAGWAKQTIWSSPGDRPGRYRVEQIDDPLFKYDDLWLLR